MLTLRYTAALCLLGLLFSTSLLATDAGYAGRNVNVMGPPPVEAIDPILDHGLRQQNEPSCAVNPENPSQICCGFNDYRGIDKPELGDAWEGIACSRDGGGSWNSQLIAGHRADPEHSLNLEFAADPNLVAAPGGLFFNYIAADRNQIGGLYMQRYAWRNKEDGWPLVQAGGPILIAKGTSGRFIDKPHMHGFLDDSSSANVTMSWDGAQTRTLPAGNLGVAAAVFVGNDNNDGTKILYWNSSDWGATWDQPTKLTESTGVNSGINLAANGDRVCAVWRRFDDTNETNSVLFACSEDRGARFSKPQVLEETMCPFDLSTLDGSAIFGEGTDAVAPVAFRSNAFPVIAADGENFFVFWSDRGHAIDSNGAAGCKPLVDDPLTGGLTYNPNGSYSRIVYNTIVKTGRNKWDAGFKQGPQTVDDAPGLKAHQFMPAAYGANGEVVVAWLDTREDAAKEFNLDLALDKVYIWDFWQGENAIYRHTLDIRSTRISGGNFAPESTKVSNYRRGLYNPGTGVVLRDLEFNLPNARMFKSGTAPFVGDYVSVTAPLAAQNAAGKWQNSNTATRVGSSTFHISWADNRDVRGKAWGTQPDFADASPYTPTDNVVANGAFNDTGEQTNLTPTVEDDPNGNPESCAAGDSADRTRDQNVYSAALYPAATLQAPGAVKLSQTNVGDVTSITRAMPVVIQNRTEQARWFRLVASPAANVSASFSQTTAKNSVDVRVWGKSSSVRTVFAASASELPAVDVTAYSCADKANACDTVVASVTLNNDTLEFGGNLEQPGFGASSIFAQEQHDPSLLNPSLLNPDLLRTLWEYPELANFLFGAAGADLLNPSLTANTSLVDAISSNPDILNVDMLNPTLLNTLLANPTLLNPTLLNPDLLNPTLLNPTLLNPTLLNPALWDLIAANPTLLNPTLLNPTLLNNLVENPTLLNPDLLNLIIANPTLLNPTLLNTLVANPTLLNPTLLNAVIANPTLLNTIVSNPTLLNPTLLNIMVENPTLLNPTLLNTIVANPTLLNSALWDLADQPGNLDLLTEYVADPDSANPTLLNLVVENPTLLNPTLLNTLVANPTLLNPTLLNLFVENPTLLNPTLLNPTLLNPTLLNPTLLNQLVANPTLLNPTLLNPTLLNPTLLNPTLLNPTLLNPDLLNPDLMNAVLLNPTLLNQLVANPTLLNPTLLNPTLLNPTLLNEVLANPTLLNPDLLNPTLLNPTLLNAPISYADMANPDTAPADPALGEDYYIDVTYQVRNDGNTTTGYVAQTYIAGPTEAYSGTQVIVSKPYLRQTTRGCQPVLESTNNVVVNITNPVNREPIPNLESSSDEAAELASFWLAPGEVANVTIRVFSGDPNALFTDRVGLYVNSEACNSGSTCDAKPFVSTVREYDETAPTWNEDGFETNINGGEATGPDGAIVFYTRPTASDNIDGSVSVDCAIDSGELFPVGTTEHNCIASDSAGNETAPLPFSVTVSDTIAPELSVTAPAGFDPNLEATSPAGAAFSFTGFSFETYDMVDLEPAIACVRTENGTAVSTSGSTTLPLGDSTIACVATDNQGNGSDPYTLELKVADTTAPVLDAVPLDFSAEATSLGGNTYVFTPPTATDTVSGSLSASCDAPTIYMAGVTYTVSCSATDAAGQTTTTSFTVTFSDTTAPEFNADTVPGTLTIEATSPTANSFSLATLPTADDLVNGTLTASCEIPAELELGTTTITCSASDRAGNTTTTSFDVTFVDTTAPAFTSPAPADFALEDTTGLNAVALALPVLTAVDTVAGNVIASCEPAGPDFGIGTTLVTCTASDGNGNAAAQSFNVIVADKTAPVIDPATVPASSTVEATSLAANSFAFSVPVATDAFEGSVPVSCDAPDGFGIGLTTVTCTARDTAGNETLVAFAVTVVDTTAPALVNLPGNRTEEATSTAGAVSSWPAVSATDVVDGVLPVSCDAQSGAVFSLGTTVVSCTVSDAAGNSSSGIFSVSVVDTTAPTLVVPGDVVAEATSPAGASVSFTAPTASDTASSSVATSCDAISGAVFPIGLTPVNCTATDAQGLASSASFTVTVRDTTAPTLGLPASITVEASSPAGNNVTYPTASASDAADASLSVSCTPTSGSSFALGTTPVNCSVSDTAGNTSSGQFSVTVADTTPPQLNLPADISADAIDAAGAAVSFSVSATDAASSSVEISCDATSGDVFPVGSTTVNCSATDAQGLTSSGSFSIAVNVGIVWITPIEETVYANIGPNLNLRWGYGSTNDFFDSRDFLTTGNGKSTAPIEILYLGADESCNSDAPKLVDIDAGKSSLRYGSGEWQLNWQTGQSLVALETGTIGLVAGCYEVRIPRTGGQTDTKTVILN